MLPELLAPAGSPEALDAAIGEGADAVYLGLKSFNARMRSANFAFPQFESALKNLHRMGRKIYVTVNTVFEEREADRMYQLLKYLAGLGPDGILVQDFGVVTMARDNFPSLKLHASTQMNIAGSRGVNLLSRYGFSRAVLARELSLDEIRGIRRNTNMELEVFVHGALCMSVSGLCLFSSYLGGKSANRGMCAQACRRFYYPEDSSGGSSEGAYYFSPNDLELIEQTHELCGAGVNSFKIEGRMKSAEYVGAVVSAYRLVLDSLESGGEEQERAMKKAREILGNDFARAKTAFLFNGGTSLDWLNPGQSGGTGIPLGKILKVKGSPRHGLVAAGPVLPVEGDTIRLHSADDSNRKSHKVFSVEDEPANTSGTANRWVSIPDEFGPGDAVYLIQTKAMTRRYPKIIDKKNAETGVRGPGRDKASPPKSALKPARDSDRRPDGPKQGGGKRRAALDEGLYVQAARIEDLYALQSDRPQKVILLYSRRLLSRLLNKAQPLPFTADNIIVSLDPFFPQSAEDGLAEDIKSLLDRGYRYFMVNNPGQFSLFRKDALPAGADVVLVAGPWLYAYNSWALAFINGNGADYFVSPLENNRQNLERTLSRDKASRRNAFVTVYTRPSLFRIRSNLAGCYDFGKFSGHADEMFSLAASPEGSFVYPETPFYIGDKIPFLREAGFRRFIVDLSSGPVKKNEYRELMRNIKEAAPSAGMSRFNWKNGFFQDKQDQPGR